MRQTVWAIALICAVAAAAPAGERWRTRGDEGPCYPPCESPYAPMPATQAPGTLPSDVAQPPTSSFSEALASAGEGGTQPGASYMPGFFGDLIGGTTDTAVFFPSADRTIVVPLPTIAQASAIKIAESDSPRPVDRLYYLYNYYGNIFLSPDVAPMQLHRHVIGFEKTLFGGDFSIGMRLPIFSEAGDPSVTDTFLGDISIITKYALINNPQTGNVLSFGLAITAPTGGSPVVPNELRPPAPAPRDFPVLLQPYGGYIYNIGPRLYFHGFHSVVVPTTANEPTFMSNDVGLGFWLYRNPDDSLVRGIIPTLEVHINTPFNHREPATTTGQVQMIDTTTFTIGSYLLFPRSIFGGAVGVPLGAAPNRIEALASYTWRW